MERRFRAVPDLKDHILPWEDPAVCLEDGPKVGNTLKVGGPLPHQTHQPAPRPPAIRAPARGPQALYMELLRMSAAGVVALQFGRRAGDGGVDRRAGFFGLLRIEARPPAPPPARRGARQAIRIMVMAPGASGASLGPAGASRAPSPAPFRPPSSLAPGAPALSSPLSHLF